MMMTIEQDRLLHKYFNSTKDDKYISKGKEIPKADLEQIKEIDETNVELYGEHLIIDYKKVFGN